MNDPLHELLLTLLAGLSLVAVGLVVLLVAVRASSELLERRSERRRDDLRLLILTALLGEDEEADAAMADLRRREGRAWRLVERQAFSMLPKIKGDSHDALVALLLSRGAAGRATEEATARSLVRRARGAYQLGALGDLGAAPILLGLLGDSRFLVRRTAVRALGQIGDPEAVIPLLDAVSSDPALTRDVVAALQRIGTPAAPTLRNELSFLLGGGPRGRRGALVATALGLLGDVASAPVLVRAVVVGRHAGLAAAAAEALGNIGVPAAVPALLDALGAEDREVQVRAASALGQIGDVSAAQGLAARLGTDVREVDRAIAGALLRLAPVGLSLLEQHASPYAAEALAVHRMQSAA